MNAEKVILIIESLKNKYPLALCSLEYEEPFQLLISTRLAAQCTDARVNIVTPKLFEKFSDIDSLAQADVGEVEEIIKSCGLYKRKAVDIVLMCQMLRDYFNGKVPDNMDDLLKLPGVGRKTANLILGDIYKKPAVVTDTHCIRITNRLGMTTSKNPLIVERQLRELLPAEESNDFCHRIVLFGRDICTARSPKCTRCLLSEICPSADLQF